MVYLVAPSLRFPRLTRGYSICHRTGKFFAWDSRKLVSEPWGRHLAVTAHTVMLFCLADRQRSVFGLSRTDKFLMLAKHSGEVQCFVSKGEDIVNFSAIIRRTGEVSIVDLTGQLTSFASGALRDTVGGLIRQGRKKIVLNVHGLHYLDSSGVGELVNCYMSVIKQGGEMKVVGLTPKVEEVLKITQLYRVFQEFQDEETALQSFPDNRKKESA
jgi:anti-sigma B factor antagonist